MQTPPVSRASIAVAAFSTIVEWYDFTLYLYFASVLGRVFFGGGDAGVAAALAGFAIAYLLRPLGALVFGHVGDRFGRRRSLLLSVALITVAMFASAALPAGAIGGVLLLGLRCVMGFAVGGEYNAVVAYLLESAPEGRRGLVASLASAASEVGGLLAVGVCFAVVTLLTDAAVVGWGWRLPFVVGGVLAASVGLARAAMQESPDFIAQQVQGAVPNHPVRHVLAHHKAGIVRAFAISALGSITYYVGITYVPAFLTATGVPERDALQLSTIAAVAVIAITPVTGILSDRYGRRRTLLVLAALSALLPIALFWLMANGTHALFGAVILALVAGAVSAVGAVATAEQFPGPGRVSGLALGQTTATVIFGGLAPYAAHLLMRLTGSPLVPGAMIAAVAIAILPVLRRLPD